MKSNLPADCPAMYKMNFAQGRSVEIKYGGFLFVYVCSGEGTMRASGSGYPARKGSAWILAGGEAVSFRTESSMQAVHIRIPEDAVTEYLLHASSPAAARTEKAAGAEDAGVMAVPDHVLLRGLVSGIEAGVDNHFRANRPLTRLKLQECIHVLTCLRPELHGWFARMNRPQKICLRRFMECHYRENLPLERMALASGRSLSTFRRDFLKTFGTTPGKWLLARRLEEAYVLIREKQARPSELLSALGFESFSHFSRSFKAYFGVQASAVMKESTVK